MDLNVTQIKSIEHTWKTVIQHIFHVKGADVRSVCNCVTEVPLDSSYSIGVLRFISM